MKKKGKKAIFLLQLGENYIKAAKFLIRGAKKELSETAWESILPLTDDKSLVQICGRILKKLGYTNNPVIVSLPRNLATCRSLKVPTQSPGEIEKIVSLQASRYLPYPAGELITGYETISTDKQGFSNINLVIAHKKIIDRYISIFNALKPEKFNIFLNSVGLSNLYSYLKPDDTGPVMAIDIDLSNVEVVVIEGGRLTFSRNFRLNNQQPQWKKILIDEINKSRDAYSKEFSKEPPGRVYLFGKSKASKEVFETLTQLKGFSIEELLYNDFADSFEHSFAGLVGLGLVDTNESLSLLPPDAKEKIKTSGLFKERLRIGFFATAIIIIWAITFAKNLDNKAKYLARLKEEIKKIATEAKPLEDIERKFKIIENISAKRVSALEILHDLNKILPENIYLNSITYEEGADLTLRGQAQELNSVLAFVTGLEHSMVFKQFNIKIRYATKKKIITGEIVDFEIACLKK